MLYEFLFVYSEKDGSFPERLCVLRDGQDPDIPDVHRLTGTVSESGKETLRAKLRRDYPAPEFSVATTWANRWMAVQRNYAGLDYESDQPSSAGTGPTSSEETSATHPFGRLLLETTATGSTRALFLLAAVLCFGVVAGLWPEFSHRYGSAGGWVLTLLEHPLDAAGGLILPVAFVAGGVALLRFVRYARARVFVYRSGLVFQPGDRSLRWGDVEHVWYASRSLRPYGAPVGTRQSLSLQPRGGRTLFLSHRFHRMEELISLVRTHVEPVLLEQARERLRREGRLSLGKSLTLTPDHLTVETPGVDVPLDRVDRAVIRGGTLQILSTDNRVIYSDSAERTPNVFVLSPLLAELKRPRSAPSRMG